MKQAKNPIWNVLKYIFVIGYLVAITCVAISLFPSQNLESNIVETVIDQGVEQKILDTTNTYLPILLEDSQVDQINSDLEDLMSDNAYLQNIVGEYADAIKETVSTSNGTVTGSVADHLDETAVQQNVSDFSNQVTQKIADETNLDANALSSLITQKMIEKVSQLLNDKVSTQCDNFLTGTTNSTRSLMKLYIIVTSQNFRTISIVAAVILLILILVVSRPIVSCLVPLGIVHLLEGIGCLVVATSLTDKMEYILARRTGYMVEIDGTNWMIYGGVMAAVGVICLLAGILLNRRKN